MVVLGLASMLEKSPSEYLGNNMFLALTAYLLGGSGDPCQLDRKKNRSGSSEPRVSELRSTHDLGLSKYVGGSIQEGRDAFSLHNLDISICTSILPRDGM